MPHIPIELYIEQLKFLPGNEVYRCKLVSREWNLLIENCQAILPIAPSFPSYLNPDDSHHTINISSNKHRVEFTGENDDDTLAGCVRANCSIPRVVGLYYYEVSIINGGQHNYIGVGLSKKGTSLNMLPGWRWGSLGYHGDDGHLFDGTSGLGKDYGPKFTTNDIIGCGINFVKKEFFYTKNGENLGVAKTGLKTHKELYPLVGLNSPGEIVEVNFGQNPFLYNIQGDIEENRNIPTSSLEIKDSSSDTSSDYSFESSEDIDSSEDLSSSESDTDYESESEMDTEPEDE